ncbi:MAG: hypothetical protein V4654_14105 [Bdellovibrionota bacterium]
MKNLMMTLLFPLISLASEGHSHGDGGENEHLYPVLIVFAVLIIGGVIFHFVSKKKR